MWCSHKRDLLRYIEGWKIKGKYAAFLSHFKAQAAAEARILKLELTRALRLDDDQVHTSYFKSTLLRQACSLRVPCSLIGILWRWVMTITRCFWTLTI